MKTLFKQFVRGAICSLNQHPLDFHNNLNNIKQSIILAKEAQCKIRLGAELQISGYMCQDHFNQYDTVFHSWQVIYDLLESGVTNGILCDVGMPVLHKCVLYNCRVLLLDSKILGIRAKMNLADGGNYFQSRWFSSWKLNHIQQFTLPQAIAKLTGQQRVPIGYFILKCNDADIGFQICEQAWISENPMAKQALDGAEIFFNSSGSHIQEGKLARKIQLINESTQKHGGAYLYANSKGCDGTRLLFDGGCMFSLNGKLKALSPLFSLSNISITQVEFSLHQIKNYRITNKSFTRQAANNQKTINRVQANITLGSQQKLWNLQKAEQMLNQIKKDYLYPNVTYQPSLYIWDYLKKSKANGFYLALSGGADSACVSLVVFNLCKLLYSEIVKKNKTQVLKQLRAVIREEDYVPKSPEQICSKIFFTAYLGTQNSSQQTRNRAKNIADQIGANHKALTFTNIFATYKQIINQVYNFQAKFEVEGGTKATDLCLQNLQARNRMTLIYMLAQLQLASRNRRGFLLVITSSNLDESLRGYLTKYDCSSGDINPIGSLSKTNLKQYLIWNKQNGIKFVDSILNADPTAELTPLKQGVITQSDQADMGITYAQLKYFGLMRKNQKLGPVFMFQKLIKQEYEKDPKILGEKVKHFFRHYSINRHKQTTITPSFHYQSSSCDDNRYDMRPFLYNTEWKFQFQQIDQRVKQIISNRKQYKSNYMIQK